MQWNEHKEMALKWMVCCSQKAVSALQVSCKDSECKRYSYSTFYFVCLCFHCASKVSAADIRAPALWMGPQTHIFLFYFWWVAWGSAWRSEVACPKDSQLHGFIHCLVPICISLLKPSLSWKFSLAAAGCTAEAQLTASIQQQWTADDYFECREGWHSLRCGLLEKTSHHDAKHKAHLSNSARNS